MKVIIKSLYLHLQSLLSLSLSLSLSHSLSLKYRKYSMFALQLIMKIPNVVVKLEGGVGKRTVPLLIAETSLDAQVRDWSSRVGNSTQR